MPKITFSFTDEDRTILFPADETQTELDRCRIALIGEPEIKTMWESIVALEDSP